MTQRSVPWPVIAGVDGSAAGLRAARLAADEARRRAAPLRLVHVLSRPFEGIVPPAPPELDLPDLQQQAAQAAVQAATDEVAGLAGGQQMTSVIEQGEPVDVLRAVSTEAQLLVLGGRGVGGIAALFVGSTAHGVVTEAGCPVVVLPADETVTVVRGRRSVVVGVEGRPGDDEVLALAFEEAAGRGTDLVAVHAWQDVALQTSYESLDLLVDWEGVGADEERVLAESLAGWQQKWPDVVVRTVVVRDKTARALLAAALTAELLVVGHRHRHRLATLRSTTHAVLHRAPCPVAVVPIAAARTHTPRDER